MRCRQAKKLIFDYIDGVISESDRVGLEHHLTGCRTCEAMASSLTRSLDLLHRVPNASPSENFNWKLRLRMAKAKNAWGDSAESEWFWQRKWNTRFAVGAVSAFVVVLVGGLAVLRSDWGTRGGGDRVAQLSETALPQKSTVNATANDQRRAYVPFEAPRSTGFYNQPVATGAMQGWETNVRGYAGSPVIDVDSLKIRFLEARMGSQRIRQLEQQIEILHNELEKCSAGQDK
jgi:hypothetical protein